MKKIVLAFMCLSIVGCSSGLKEVGFAIPDHNDKVHYIVNRSLVNDRMTSNQPHTTGQFHCINKYSSEEMAELRSKYGDHTWYTGCTPLEDMPAHKYVLTSDQSIASLLQGPLSAAILAGGIGAGLAFSGDDVTVNQSGGGASARSFSKANGGSVNIRSKYGRW